jgi:hypothetical protein
MLSDCMRIGRTILAFWVALSLALLPMAGAYAVQNDELATSDVQVEPGHDCCDDEGIPAGSAMKECQASAACVAKCFNFFAVVLAASAIVPPTGGMEPPFADDGFCSHTGSPPFRPPRV